MLDNFWWSQQLLHQSQDILYFLTLSKCIKHCTLTVYLCTPFPPPKVINNSKVTRRTYFVFISWSRPRHTGMNRGCSLLFFLLLGYQYAGGEEKRGTGRRMKYSFVDSLFTMKLHDNGLRFKHPKVLKANRGFHQT